MKKLSIALLIVSLFSLIAPMAISADTSGAPPAIWDFGTSIGPETAWFNFHNRGEHTLTDNSIILTVKSGQTTKPELNLKAADYSIKDMQWCRIRIKVIQGDSGRIDLYVNKNGAAFTANDMATFNIDGTKSGYQTYIVNMPKANGNKAGGAWLDQTAYTTRLRIDYIASSTAGDSREIDYIAFFPTYQAAIGWKNEAGSATVIDENGTSTTVTLTAASGGETTTAATTTAASTTSGGAATTAAQTTSAQTFDFIPVALMLIVGMAAMIAVVKVGGKRVVR
ncbi:MAG: hypothetical protein GX936_00165 [Clostridiales bacterium]|nr:hypothetical protein [Clostridiales bacterium]